MHIFTRALRLTVKIMFVYLETHNKRFLLHLLSTRPLPDETRLPQNETSAQRNCDRQCRDDFGESRFEVQ